MGDATATTGVSGNGRNSRTDMISMLTQLAPALFGTGTQSTSTTTTGGKNITPEALQALIGNMMSSSNGLASVLMPQRQAGLYNSPVNSLLAQQLTSRIAGEAAAQSTQETKTTTQATKTGASPTGKLLAGGLGLLQAGSMAKSAWQNKDKIAEFAKDPAAAIASIFGEAGVSGLGSTADMASELSSAAIGNGVSSFTDLGIPSVFSNAGDVGASVSTLLNGMNFAGADGVSASAVDAFQNLLAPDAVKNLAAGGFEIGDTVLNISGGSDAVAGAGSAATDWISNTPGSEAADYLTAEGFGDVGMELSDVGSSAASGVPYLNIGANLLDGNWDWGDTGSAIGSYFGGPIGAWVGSTIGEPVGEVVEGIGGALSDAVDGIGDFISDIGGGCFLTTACMSVLAHEFDDDCRELEAMRAMRDGYMQTLDEGPALIKEYYKMAPSYVMWINAREDAEDVWKHLYNDYIMPAVIAYEKEHFHKSYETYVRMVREVERLVHEEEGV